MSGSTTIPPFGAAAMALITRSTSAAARTGAAVVLADHRSRRLLRAPRAAMPSRRQVCGPWFHQLRCGSLRFVRRLHSYDGRVQILMSVHHRLRFLTFPMRTANTNTGGQTRGIPGPGAIHSRVMCSSTAGGTAMSRITTLHILRSAISDSLRSRGFIVSGSLTHPTQPLCTLRVRRCRRLTQHSLPASSLGLT